MWYLKYPSASLCLFTLISPSNTDIAGFGARDHAFFLRGKKNVKFQQIGLLKSVILSLLLLHSSVWHDIMAFEYKQNL